VTVIESAAEAHHRLRDATARARERGLPYAGDLHPLEAWALVEFGAATIVDVRSPEEWLFVGHVPGSVLVPWAAGAELRPVPDFAGRLADSVPRDGPLLFLCRSARRSVSAAVAATRAGRDQAYNLLEGFEGELDERGRRGSAGGWRWHGLPWVQS
jgi:rhodanese-related sulfurtransferase